MSTLSRRDFLSLGAGVMASAYLAGCGSTDATSVSSGLQPGVPAPSAPNFPQPQLFSSVNGRLDATLVAQMAQNQLGQFPTLTRTYGGRIGGPTFSVAPGDTFGLNVQNALPANTDPAQADQNIPHDSNSTNMHTHGMHVSPQTPSDNVLLTIDPGQSFQYSYQIPLNHPPGTYFYHPHLHGSVSVQMLGGMSGALIVRGGLDNVPEIAAAADIVMLIQEIYLDASGQVPSMADQSAFFAAVQQTLFPINGQLNPTLRMRTGEVQRWRLVHGGVNTFLDLAMEGHQLNLVALDGIAFSALETVDHLVMAGSQRAEVLIRAGAPGTYQLQALPYDQGQGPTPPQPLALATIVVEPSGLPAMALPTNLPAPFQDIADNEITGHRQLTFESLPPSPNFDLATWLIDNRAFDANRIDQSITLGSVEEWTIFNTATEQHSFHIHINPFQVVAINGQPLPKPVWHDTVILPAGGSVTVRHRFLDYDGLYVLHCHILLHECTGMMQLVDVVKPGLSMRERYQRSRRMERIIAKAMRGPSKVEEEFCGPRPLKVMRWGTPRQA